MNPHLLYIAFWYPPSRASGVYRALATVKMFSEAGWHVTVLTTSTEYFEDEIGSTDETLLAEIPADVDVVRVPFSTGLTAGVDIRSLNRWSANFPALWKATHRGSGESISERYTGWIDPAVSAGVDIDAVRRVDHVLATGNPYSAFEAARLIADAIGSPFSVDYRDPWTIDVFTGERIGDQSTREAERRILDEAGFAFHVNDAIADAYKQAYPGSAAKHRVVFNGYDPESIPGQPDATPPPYRFGILGTMNDRWPMPAIFKGWDLSRRDLPDGCELVLAGHLGYFEHSREVLESKLPGSDSGFTYVGPVHKADVSEFYDSVDVVILPVPGGPMVTSGKVFEALALGKPIVCVQGEDGGARALLVNHPLSIGVEPDAESVRAGLLRAAEMAGALDPSVVAQARANAERFERRQAMIPMLEAIDSFVSPPSGGSTGEAGEGGEPQDTTGPPPSPTATPPPTVAPLPGGGNKPPVSPPSGGSPGEAGEGGEPREKTGPDWLLILGGVTKTGHRRAERVAVQAASSGLDVVWFDGLVDDEPGAAPTGSEVSGSSSTVGVVGFGEELSRTMSGRLRSGAGLRTSALGRQLWRVLRKVGGLLQPRACWRVIEDHIDQLAQRTSPARIVYTDDQAITSAWYASRIWRSAPVSTDLPSAS